MVDLLGPKAIGHVVYALDQWKERVLCNVSQVPGLAVVPSCFCWEQSIREKGPHPTLGTRGGRGVASLLQICSLEIERGAREDFVEVLLEGSILKHMSLQMAHMLRSLHRQHSQEIMGFP